MTHFVRVEKFLPFCQQCGSYNTRWTCPPFDFDPMTIWRSYTGLRLYARILQADVPEQPLDEEQLKAAVSAAGYTVKAVQTEPYEKKGFSLFHK